MPIIPHMATGKAAWVASDIILTISATGSSTAMSKESMTQLWEEQVDEQTQWFPPHFLASPRLCLLAAVLYTKQQGATNTLCYEKKKKGRPVRSVSIIRRNSEWSNAANYCSCWQIQPQNHSSNCKLHAPTTVTTKAAQPTAKLITALSSLLPRWQFPWATITQKTEGNSAGYTVSVGV